MVWDKKIAQQLKAYSWSSASYYWSLRRLLPRQWAPKLCHICFIKSLFYCSESHSDSCSIFVSKFSNHATEKAYPIDESFESSGGGTQHGQASQSAKSMVDFHRRRLIVIHVDTHQQHRQHCIAGHVPSNGGADCPSDVGGLKLPNCDVHVLIAIWQVGWHVGQSPGF